MSTPFFRMHAVFASPQGLTGRFRACHDEPLGFLPCALRLQRENAAGAFSSLCPVVLTGCGRLHQKQRLGGYRDALCSDEFRLQHRITILNQHFNDLAEVVLQLVQHASL